MEKKWFSEKKNFSGRHLEYFHPTLRSDSWEGESADPTRRVKIAPHFRRPHGRTRGRILDLSFDLGRQLLGAYFSPEAQQSPTPGRGRKKPPKTDQVFTGNRRPFGS